jgi:hypothetical protein
VFGHLASTLQRHGSDKVPPTRIWKEAQGRVHTQPLDEQPQVQQGRADLQQQRPAPRIGDGRQVSPQFDQRAGRMP